MPTLSEIEKALDSGRLQIKMVNGNWWKVRRNGKTKLWVKSPEKFRIPIKCGLKVCGAIEESHLFRFFEYYRIID